MIVFVTNERNFNFYIIYSITKKIKNIKYTLKYIYSDRKQFINLLKMHHNSGKITSDIENMEWNMGTTTAQLSNVRYDIESNL